MGALGVAVLCSVQCHSSSHPGIVQNTQARAEIVPTAAVVMDAADRNEQLARTDAFQFLQYCWDQYRRNIHDYSCTFAKQELIEGQVTPLQKADVKFMAQPFSVDMTFVENIRECKRALYVEGKWFDDAGNAQAWAKPGGAILRTLVPRIKQPIHGSRAQRASRRTIDQFGFGKTFELIMKYSIKARDEGKLDLEYVGQGVVAGRPTYVFERRLPYDGNESNYPDNLLVINIDQEYLVPTSCQSYSDSSGQSLLGSYVYSDLHLNNGFTADDFDPDKINF